MTRDPGTARHRRHPAARAARPGARRAHRVRTASHAFTAALITLVTVVAGFGLLSLGPGESASATEAHAAVIHPGGGGAAAAQESLTAARVPGHHPALRAAIARPAVPARSGHGKRVVFDISDQRVWLVRKGGEVASTYLVSGSLTDNLHPGHYAVYSRSRWAVGIDDSGVMQYFVRFTRGKHAAIGFHSIPTKHGRRLQTRQQLGTPQSHGCIRQWLPDAIRLWHFAPLGTRVVVTS